MDATDVIDDLVAEQDRIEAILAGLDEDAWLSPSAAAGWSIADVVLHLAQTEEAVVATVEASDAAELDGIWRSSESVDAIADRLVTTERAAPEAIFDRWRTARRAAVDALRAAPAALVTTAG